MLSNEAADSNINNKVAGSMHQYLKNTEQKHMTSMG